MIKPRISSILITICAIAICGIFALTTPRFGPLYAEGASYGLPIPTRFVMTIAPIGWILLGVIAAVFLVVKDLHLALRRVPNWYFAMVLVLATVAVIIALYAPFFAVGNNLGQKP